MSYSSKALDNVSKTVVRDHDVGIAIKVDIRYGYGAWVGSDDEFSRILECAVAVFKQDVEGVLWVTGYDQILLSVMVDIRNRQFVGKDPRISSACHSEAAGLESRTAARRPGSGTRSKENSHVGI
jgi:hypothetical protein